jgi:hypothetical protein
VSTDEYGVPFVIFGSHHEDFFPLLGRIVAISAVIERDVRTLAGKLVSDPAVLNGPSIKKVIGALRDGLERVDNTDDRRVVASYVSDADSAFERRNDYVHGLWPSVSLGRGSAVVGWRQEPWKGELVLDVNLTEMRDDAKRYAELAMRWNDEVIYICNRLPIGPVKEES